MNHAAATAATVHSFIQKGLVVFEQLQKAKKLRNKKIEKPLKDFANKLESASSSSFIAGTNTATPGPDTGPGISKNMPVTVVLSDGPDAGAYY